MDKFGLIDKPICTIDGQILGGHQRLRILKDEGIKEVECWIPEREMNQREIDELLLRLNKNTGEWDFEMLANDFDIADIFEAGFTAEDLHLDVEEGPPKEKKDKECPHCGGKI